MTIIHKIVHSIKKKYKLFSIIGPKTIRIQNFNPAVLLSLIVIFSGVFFITSNLINKKNKENLRNLKEISEASEFSNLAEFFISKIKSPYEEIEYVIKNNDTIEKILKKNNVRDKDIKNISLKLKEKKFIQYLLRKKTINSFEKLEDESKTIVNFIYPINNTTSVEVRKVQDNFIVKEKYFTFI